MASRVIEARGKVFRDQVHGLIKIESGDEFILDLINSPEFQRLRRVRQLGVSSLTYPGAEHTRFAHSLGVFNFAQRIVSLLLVRYRKEKEVVDLLEQNQKIIKAAALLHDIGHGPFSHMIERAFPALADHEEKTVSIIKESEIIPKILESAQISPEAVADLINKKTPHRILVDIVSSQLDADRMDYILRDALNTGVRYGTYDSEWVLHSLCIGQEPGVKNGSISTLRLCLDEKRGLASAEQIVMARMHMSFQVYYHKATRGWEAHMLCLLNLASQLAKEEKLPLGTPKLLISFLTNDGKLDDNWRYFDESCLEAALHLWASEGTSELSELSRRFLLREKFFDYADLGSISIATSIKLAKEAAKIGQESVHWLLDDPTFTSYKDFDAGFRTPRTKDDGAAISTSAILISSGEIKEEARPAEAVSLVLRALGENPIGTRQSIRRLYYCRSLKSEFQKIFDDLSIKTR